MYAVFNANACEKPEHAGEEPKNVNVPINGRLEERTSLKRKTPPDSETQEPWKKAEGFSLIDTLNGTELGSMTEENPIIKGEKLILLRSVKLNLHKLSLFTNLVSLDVSQTNLALKYYQVNEGIEILSSLTTLQVLNWGKRHLDDTGLGRIAHLINLKTLIIPSPFLFGPRLANLNQLSFLEELGISGTHVNAHYLNLLQLPNLRSLGVSSSFVSQEELDDFKEKTRLNRKELQLPPILLKYKRI